MIDKVNISNEELRNLHEKGAKVNPSVLKLGHLSHSGRHIHDIMDEDFV